MGSEAKHSLGPSIGCKHKNALCVWLFVPRPGDTNNEPYGDSLRIGFLRGLTDHSYGPECLKERRIRVDTIYTSSLSKSSRPDGIISENALRELYEQLRPDICVGEIRSDVAAELVRFCSRREIILLGTDHAATRLRDAASDWYFRISPTCDQMVGGALDFMLRDIQLHAKSVYRSVKRIALVFPNYDYGHAFAADCQRWIATPRPDRRFGLTHAVEVGTAFSRPPKRPSALSRSLCWSRIKQCHPDAIMLGLWGDELMELLESRPMHDGLEVPLIIPDAGWDQPCVRVAFPLGSIVGARYYFPTECWTTPCGLPGIKGNLWDKSWLESIGGRGRWTTHSLRYQVGAAAEAGRLVADIFTHAGDGRDMEQGDKPQWRGKARRHLQHAKVRSFGYDDWAAAALGPTRSVPLLGFTAIDGHAREQHYGRSAVRSEVREYRVEHVPPLRVCVTDGARMKDTAGWRWTTPMP